MKKRHIKLFENFDISESTTIFDFIDYDEPEEPMFYINNHEGEPEDIKTTLEDVLKNGEINFEISDASGETSIDVVTDNQGNILSYTGGGEDADGEDRFDWIELN